jgi:hypothetical protein
MKRLAALLIVVAIAAGCKVHPHAAPTNPVGKPHPQGAPPGQVKKLYKCGSCGVTQSAAGSCHGKALIVVTP